MLKLMTVVGARPQFVKAAVLSRKLREREYTSQIQEILVHTGQHYDENMSDVFFREMQIPAPDYNLEVGSGSHGATTGAMLVGIEGLILQHKPDVLLVYGDTNSTLAGALAASKLHVPVAHVEAGLRSYMMSMPEEQNRRLTDHLSTWLFCPTDTAVINLNREGIGIRKSEKPSADHKFVVQCGDIMYEAFLFYKKKALELTKNFMAILPKKYYLLTIHRAENTDDSEKIKSIIMAINRYKDIEAIFPVHPRTRKIIEKYGIKFEPHVHLIDPVDYFKMLALENACEFIVTDSGGVQKEAFFNRKPCVTLQDATGWVEQVKAGWNTLVGSDEEKIYNTLCIMPKFGKEVQLYGDGQTSKHITEILLKNF